MKLHVHDALYEERFAGLGFSAKIRPADSDRGESERQLIHEPTKETRNRKPLRPNDLSQWELRVGDFRVFYDVDVEKEETLIKAVGEKGHNKLYIRGKEYEL